MCVDLVETSAAHVEYQQYEPRQTHYFIVLARFNKYNLIVNEYWLAHLILTQLDVLYHEMDSNW